MSEFDHQVDVRGLNCPLPILRAKKALAKINIGETLEVLSTDPGSVKDFEAFSNQTGNELLSSEDNNGEFRFLLRKS
jgi:tRNA 2-thiouridine synthesizing protein A